MRADEGEMRTPATDAASRAEPGLSSHAGKRLLVVMGSYEGKRPVYARLRELGLELVVLDGPGHWCEAESGGSLVQSFIAVDLRPDERRLERALAAIEKHGEPIDAVITFDEFASVLAAEIAQALDRPGHPPAVVARSRDKLAVREACRAAGLPSPRFAAIRGDRDIAAAGDIVGFPAILKPTSGASSVSSFRVDHAGDLRRRHREVVGAAARLPPGRALQSNGDEFELIWACGGEMILEECLVGDEFDVDCLMCGGRMVYAGVTRDWPQPFCKEVGAEMPPLFEATKIAEIELFAAKVLDILGFRDGVFHVEIIHTADGPRLVEVNARMGGGPRREMHRLVWGVDLAEQYVLKALGSPIRPEAAAEPMTCIAQSFLPSPRSGRIERGDFLKEVEGDARVIECKAFVDAGQEVVGSGNGPADWLGNLMVRGDSPSDAITAIEEIVARIEFPIAAPERS